MQNIFYRIVFCFLAVSTFIGCNRDSGILPTPLEEDLGLRIPDSEIAQCKSCPSLRSFNLIYQDESRVDSVDIGRFQLGLGINNDYTQDGGIPAKIELFDYMEDENTFKLLNYDPLFELFLDHLGVPKDTLNEFHPFYEYTDAAISKIEKGFYNNRSAFCTSGFDKKFHEEFEISTRANLEGDPIAKDSISIVMSGADICAMRSIVDLMTFSIYPYEIIDQSESDIYNKNNFKYDTPFAELKFDNRNLASDVDFGPESSLDNDLVLGDCAIFRSNDRTVPVEFSLSMNIYTGKLTVKSEWEDNRVLHKVDVFLSKGEFSSRGIEVIRSVKEVNGFPNGATIDLPELKEILDRDGKVNVMLRVASQESARFDDTVNSIIFELTNGSCLELN